MASINGGETAAFKLHYTRGERSARGFGAGSVLRHVGASGRSDLVSRALCGARRARRGGQCRASSSRLAHRGRVCRGSVSRPRQGLGSRTQGRGALGFLLGVASGRHAGAARRRSLAESRDF
jgi:hypothetical protein